MKRRISAALLSLCLLMSLMPTVAFAAPGGSFDDVDGHWGQAAVERWAGYGIVNGDGSGNFNPDNQMTRAEFATMLANMLGYKEKAANTFSDVNDSDWFADAILKLAAAGVMQGSNGMANPNAPITRQEAAVLMCRAFNIPTTGGNLDFADSADVADWAKGAVAALADRGMMNGVGNNNVAPLADINRASVATLLDNMITEYVTEDKTITGEVSGIVLVAADATVTVEDATLNENLIVAPKADGAEVTLTGSTTAGDVVVGAAATVKVDSNATAGEVVVGAANSTVEVAGKADAVTVDTAANNTAVNVNEGAAVGDVALNAADTKVSVAENATVSNVAVSGSNANVEVSGKVDNVTVSSGATGTGITANSGATVGKVETSANDVTVSGSGKVENVTANDGTVSVTTPGTTVENKTDSKDNVTNNGKPVEPSTGGETPTPPSGGNSGSGGNTPATTYAVSIDPEITNGTVTATPNPAAEGATVTLVITPAAGYEVGTITVMNADSENVTVTDNKFVMPAKEVTVTATFKKLPTLTVTAKTGSWGGKANTDLQDNLIVTKNGTNVTVSGISKKITEAWTNFSSNESERTGCYIWLDYTLDRGNYDDATVTIKSVDNANKPVIAAGKTQEDVISRIANANGGDKKPTLEVTIHYNTDQSILYTINLDKVTCVGAGDVVVTFDSNGGTAVAPVVVPQTEGSSKKVTEPTPPPTRTGYTLDGWYKEEGFTNTVNFNDEVTTSTTYYAKWTAKSYTVKYDLNGGTATNAPANGTATYGQSFTLNDGTGLSKDNYTFDGWSLTANGAKITSFDSWNYDEANGEKTFYAVWKPTEFNITYELVGGVNAAGNPAKYTVETNTITLAPATKEHYTFLGWFDAATGGNKVTTIEKGSTDDKTLYARWEGASFAVKYDLNYEGATGAPTDGTAKYGEAVPVPTTAPTRTGYNLVGWNTNKDADMALTGDALKVTPKADAKDVTLYAIWEPITYTVMFELNGGTNPSESGVDLTERTNVKYGENFTAPDATKLTKEGLKALGWAKEGNATKALTEEELKTLTETDEDEVTLYVVWVTETTPT